MGNLEDLRMSLADYAHTSWSGWMNYLFGKSVLNADGSVTIPPDLVARWKRQSTTDFLALPTAERGSDFLEAGNMIKRLLELYPELAETEKGT